MDSYKNNYANEDFSDITHIISYVIENHHKFLLLLLVFVIVYFVDYITYINAMLYGVTSVPGLPNLKQPIPQLPNVTNPNVTNPNVTNPKDKRSIRRNSRK